MYELLLKLCQSKGITITNLCIEVTGSPGNSSTWKKGNINPTSLTKIADYFNVSTDYLLGRTDDPTTAKENIIKSGDITGNNNSGNTGNVSVQTISEKSSSDDERLLEMIKSLDLVERSRIIVMIDEMKKGA